MRTTLSSFLGDARTEITSPVCYQVLRRKIVVIMAMVSLLPLFSLAGINYYEHQSAMTAEIQAPLRALVGKAKHSFELFLAERTSAVSFIASAYTFDELSDDASLKRIFQVMRREFTGFVDLGLIDSTGKQISYAGPYNELIGRNYSEQDWFHQVQFKGTYVSDVFMGFRKFPMWSLLCAIQRKTANPGYCEPPWTPCILIASLPPWALEEMEMHFWSTAMACCRPIPAATVRCLLHLISPCRPQILKPMSRPSQIHRRHHFYCLCPDREHRICTGGYQGKTDCLQYLVHGPG